jgi:DNA invertase Pin-like site-specific DNA recombinase
MDIGYIRVSSAGQSTDRQLVDAKLDKTFEEKVSAKNTERPKLQECIDFAREGDVIHVHSIDRLARNLLDLQQLLKRITAKGVAVKFHKEQLTFNASQADPIQNLMLQMMGAFAEFERALINERRVEGIAAAKAAGKPFGRPSTDSKVKLSILNMLRQGEKVTDVAKIHGLTRNTVYRFAKESGLNTVKWISSSSEYSK